MVQKNQINELKSILDDLDTDALFIHLNVLQEWFQPEGDKLNLSPLEILNRFFEKYDAPVWIKEVGQGLGPKSLNELVKMPLSGIEFAAFGGTNFSYMELQRSSKSKNLAKENNFREFGLSWT